MINRLSNPINRNRSAAKISNVMSSTQHPPHLTSTPSACTEVQKVGSSSGTVFRKEQMRPPLTIQPCPLQIGGFSEIVKQEC